MTPKEALKRALRTTRLLELTDTVRLGYLLIKSRGVNRKFRNLHPDFPTPPAAISFDAYGHVRADWYYETGRKTAEYVANLIETHGQVDSTGKRTILDWGCGAARVVRHLPAFFHEDRIYGTDYNSRTIKWCQENVGGITFTHNDLEPPLLFEAGTFDCIYGLSVLTHMSEKLHYLWRDELLRVLKPDGLLILTTLGPHYAGQHLSDNEIRRYNLGECVVHAQVGEGKKWFTAYQSSSFMRDVLFPHTELIDHIDRPTLEGLFQEVWILRNAAPAVPES